MALFHQEEALEYILMGRAVDMVRVMRFFQIFREIVRRSADVLPALVGPMTLVLTMLHIFVYIGMAFWGGAIEVGELTEDEITPLYDLNNFNSYMVRSLAKAVSIALEKAHTLRSLLCLNRKDWSLCFRF